VRHADNRKIWRNLMDRFPHPYTARDADEWVAHAGPITPPQHLAIEVDGAAAGGIGLDLGTDVNRRAAEIGYWLGERFWGLGIVTEALRAMTDYAFDTFDVCRLQASVFEWNAASMRVLEKAGYTLESIGRRAVTKDGHTIDRFVYVRLRP
jgi:ribosomal-protein-alanine N-acetyltransferase